MNGIISINKPQGMTSHDVVSFIRRKTGVKRVGHSGTLDPMATGVLPVFIGNATRIIEYSGIPSDPEAKIYRCRMKLGTETDTQDIWGNVLHTETLAGLPEIVEIERVCKSFEGPGTQRPPMYSAVKLHGRKLYEYARKGLEIDEEKIKEREIYIKHISVNRLLDETCEIDFDVHCSKGVYIRTLCADIGRQLGTVAVLSALERLKSDSFVIEDAIPLETLRDETKQLPRLIEADYPLGWMPLVELDEDQAERFKTGQKISDISGNKTAHGESGETTLCKTQDSIKFRVYGPSGFIGIGTVINGQLKPEKVLVVCNI